MSDLESIKVQNLSNTPRGLQRDENSLASQQHTTTSTTRRQQHCLLLQQSGSPLLANYSTTFCPCHPAWLRQNPTLSRLICREDLLYNPKRTTAHRTHTSNSGLTFSKFYLKKAVLHSHLAHEYIQRHQFHSRLPRLATACQVFKFCNPKICATEVARTEYIRGQDEGQTTIRVKEADSIRAVTA